MLIVFSTLAMLRNSWMSWLGRLKECGITEHREPVTVFRSGWRSVRGGRACPGVGGWAASSDLLLPSQACGGG